MLIPPRDKKTIVQHWYFPDKESTTLILPFVQEQLGKGAKFVWGSLGE